MGMGSSRPQGVVTCGNRQCSCRGCLGESPPSRREGCAPPPTLGSLSTPSSPRPRQHGHQVWAGAQDLVVDRVAAGPPAGAAHLGRLQEHQALGGGGSTRARRVACNSGMRCRGPACPDPMQAATTGPQPQANARASMPPPGPRTDEVDGVDVPGLRHARHVDARGAALVVGVHAHLLRGRARHRGMGGVGGWGGGGEPRSAGQSKGRGSRGGRRRRGHG
jgi:hypothetical protein